MRASVRNPVFVFLDESGDFDFRPERQRYFILGGVVVRPPFHFETALSSYRYSLLADEYGWNEERFHASYDNKYVRENVFSIIEQYAADIEVHSIVVDKGKTHPSLRKPEVFYPRMLGYLVRHVLASINMSHVSRVVVIRDQLEHKKKRKSIEKGVKLTTTRMLPEDVPYYLLQHESKSSCGLQVADYVCWAIARKWNHGSTEMYERIQPTVASEFDIFREGKHVYY